MLANLHGGTYDASLHELWRVDKDVVSFALPQLVALALLFMQTMLPLHALSRSGVLLWLQQHALLRQPECLRLPQAQILWLLQLLLLRLVVIWPPTLLPALLPPFL